MGAKCECCGYNRCQNALDLHHINPDEKDFEWGVIRANPIAWKRIVPELRKCILVCSNCHREIHAGIRTIPKNFKGFDESWLDYKSKEKLAGKAGIEPAT